jgi:hypothetical protein
MWSIGYVSPGFARFLSSLSAWKQAVVLAAIDNLLLRAGMDICDSEWGKPFGRGLYEFRVRRVLASTNSQSVATQRVLLRVFCAFYDSNQVALLSGYDKGRDPSSKRQEREISKARKLLANWKRDI